MTVNMNAVRHAIADLERETFTAGDLNRAMLLKTFKQAHQLKAALRGLVRRGELARIGELTYQVPAVPERPVLNKHEKLLRLLRVSAKQGKSVSLADLQELCGVARSYAEKWIAAQIKAGNVRASGPQQKRTYRLLKLEALPASPLLINDSARNVQAIKQELVLAQAAIERAFIRLDESRGDSPVASPPIGGLSKGAVAPRRQEERP